MNTKPSDPLSGPWTIQDLGPARGTLYPEWLTYMIRDGKTNVALAQVGDVDRYFEGQYSKIAKLMASAPALLKACQAAARYGEFADCPEVLDTLKAAIKEATP